MGGAREEVMSAGTVAQMRHVSKNPQTRRIGTRAGPSSCFQQKQAAALSRRSGRFEKKKKKMVMATRMSRKRGEVKVSSSAPESSTRVSEGAQAGSQYFQDDKRYIICPSHFFSPTFSESSFLPFSAMSLMLLLPLLVLIIGLSFCLTVCVISATGELTSFLTGTSLVSCALLRCRARPASCCLKGRAGVPMT